MINELKTFLLNTGYFKDNEYLISYLSLINGYSTNIAGYSERITFYTFVQKVM